MDLQFVVAKEKDEQYILHANREIDVASGISSSKLSQNLLKDILREKRAVCLLAKVDGENAGMIMFSKVYWADRGQGVYVSQAFVEEKFRRQGILKEMFKRAFSFFDDTKFLTCLVGHENFVMQKCVEKMNFEFEDMRSYVVNKENFKSERQKE